MITTYGILPAGKVLRSSCASYYESRCCFTFLCYFHCFFSDRGPSSLPLVSAICSFVLPFVFPFDFQVVALDFFRFFFRFSSDPASPSAPSASVICSFCRSRFAAFASSASSSWNLAAVLARSSSRPAATASKQDI